MYGLGNTCLFSCLCSNHQNGHILPTRGKGTPMVAPRKTRKIFCTVIRVSVADDNSMRANNQRPNSQQPSNRLTTRPSDLLPWADPYIARLVTKLQDEVRSERNQTRVVSRIAGNCLAELEPPSPSTDNDWDWNEEPRWSMNDEP